MRLRHSSGVVLAAESGRVSFFAPGGKLGWKDIGFSLATHKRTEVFEGRARLYEVAG